MLLRKFAKRTKFINETLQQCDRSQPYALRNSYLEGRIETVQQYFNFMHDLKHKNAEMDQIRKNLIKINKQLKKK